MKKFLTFILIVNCLFMSLFTITYASNDGYYKTFSFDVDNVKYNVSAYFPIDSKYYTVIKHSYDKSSAGDYGLIVSSSPLYYRKWANYAPSGLTTLNNSTCYVLNFNLSKDTSINLKISDFSEAIGIGWDETFSYIYSSHDIYAFEYGYPDQHDELVFQASGESKTPTIQNKDNITNLDFDNMAIFLNDYDSKERLYLHKLEVAYTVDLGDNNTAYYYNDTVFGLDFFTSYYNNDPDYPGYIIPKYKFELENNKIYYFILTSSASSISNTYNLIDYTKIENAFDGVGVSTSDSFTYEQLQQEQQKKQNDQLEENNKTNKNIFETIKEILSYLNPFSDNFILLKLWDFLSTLISYINPFSDNFLGKKIVELIGNLLKSLFVPSDEYFNNFFSDLKQWFSDRFGLLFYPFDLIINILNKITNINLSEPKFNIPEIAEPSTGKVLFKAQNYNFNDLLNTKEFKTMHDIYFVIVDAIIVFALANLIKLKLKEVETE